jgi:hypothetical protein
MNFDEHRPETTDLDTVKLSSIFVGFNFVFYKIEKNLPFI